MALHTSCKIILMMLLNMVFGSPAACPSTALLTLLQLSSDTSRDRLSVMAPLIADNRRHFCSTNNITCVFANYPSTKRYNVKGMKYYFVRKLLNGGFDCVLYIDADAVIVKNFNTQHILDSNSDKGVCGVYLCHDLSSVHDINTGVMMYTRSERLLDCMIDITGRHKDVLQSDQAVLHKHCITRESRSGNGDICLLDRSLWNAFPVPGNASRALWSSMGLPMAGDERESSYIVHFAGECHLL